MSMVEDMIIDLRPIPGNEMSCMSIGLWHQAASTFSSQMCIHPFLFLNPILCKRIPLHKTYSGGQAIKWGMNFITCFILKP